jgi:hypothetical protein
MDPDTGALPPAHDALWSGRAETLTGLLSDPEAVAELGDAARARVVERYAAATLVPTFEHEWRMLLNGQQSARRG